MAQTTKSKTLTEVLNTQIANWSVLYVKLHNYHWFVKGKSFYELHVKFEELYMESAAYLDQIAERLLAVKGSPLATMRDHLQAASMTEAAGNETPEQMVQNIIQDFSTILAELKEGIQLAEQNQDPSTADMLTQIGTSLEKHNWMLSSYLSM